MRSSAAATPASDAAAGERKRQRPRTKEREREREREREDLTSSSREVGPPRLQHRRRLFLLVTSSLSLLLSLCCWYNLLSLASTIIFLCLSRALSLDLSLMLCLSFSLSRSRAIGLMISGMIGAILCAFNTGVGCCCWYREIGHLLPNNRTCYALCHILYPVLAAHTSNFRMDSHPTSHLFFVRSDPLRLQHRRRLLLLVRERDRDREQKRESARESARERI